MAKSNSTAHKLLNRIKDFADGIGSVLLEGFHLLALFAIGATIVVAAFQAFLGMMIKGNVDIGDILLLFIYLELGAMVHIYFKTNHMPVRFLIYVAITALTRLLIGQINIEHQKPDMDLLIVAGAIFILANCELIFRYGSNRFPADKEESESATRSERTNR